VAGPLIVIVPVVFPAETVAGKIVNPVITGAVRAKDPLAEAPPEVAVTFTVTLLLTARVVTLNVAVVAPAKTVTLDGMVAEELSPTRLTVTPPVGAGPEIVTVPWVVEPPRIDAGLNVTAVASGGFTESVAVEFDPFAEAVIVALRVEAVVAVVTVKVPVVAPAAIDTGETTVTLALLELTLTEYPPEGAAPLSVIVPVVVVPPTTVVGERLTELTPGAFTVSVAFFVDPFTDAVIETGVFDATGVVVTGKVAELVPSGTVTVLVTEAAAFAEERLTA
jgi:hypothetical protein